MSAKPTGILDRILAAPRGAQFVRSDLQIHTPVDQRFKLAAGWNTATDADRERIAKGYVAAAQAAEVRILGITEHNDLTYAPLIAYSGAFDQAFRGGSISCSGGFDQG